MEVSSSWIGIIVDIVVIFPFLVILVYSLISSTGTDARQLFVRQ